MLLGAWLGSAGSIAGQYWEHGLVVLEGSLGVVLLGVVLVSGFAVHISRCRSSLTAARL